MSNTNSGQKPFTKRAAIIKFDNSSEDRNKELAAFAEKVFNLARANPDKELYNIIATNQHADDFVKGKVSVLFEFKS